MVNFNTTCISGRFDVRSQVISVKVALTKKCFVLLLCRQMSIEWRFKEFKIRNSPDIYVVASIGLYFTDGCVLPNRSAISAADPGFPRGGGRQLPGGGGHQHTILPIFPKNCMKIERIWVPGGARPSRPPPLNPPLHLAFRGCEHFILKTVKVGKQSHI